jgi:hypothetical protein
MRVFSSASSMLVERVGVEELGRDAWNALR